MVNTGKRILVRPTSVVEGFNHMSDEMKYSITKDITDMVIRVMKNGTFSKDMAASALIKSLERTKGIDNIEQAPFYQVCLWIDSYHDLSDFNNPFQLVKTIAKELHLFHASVHYILASKPFNLPDRIKPSKSGTKKDLLKTTKITATPIDTIPKVIYKDSLKDLTTINWLFTEITILKAINHSDRLFTIESTLMELFSKELEEINSRLKA